MFDKKIVMISELVREVIPISSQPSASADRKGGIVDASKEKKESSEEKIS